MCEDLGTLTQRTKSEIVYNTNLRGQHQPDVDMQGL